MLSIGSSCGRYKEKCLRMGSDAGGTAVIGERRNSDAQITAPPNK